MGTKATTTGEWLESALLELCGNMETGLSLDPDVISGLASYCDLAAPQDAAEYLHNIIGPEAGEHVIREYLQKRGYVDPSISAPSGQSYILKPYVKPPANEEAGNVGKRQMKMPKGGVTTTVRETNAQTEASGSTGISKGSSNTSRKKKVGKVVSLADAAKGSVVFQQGKPCSCQARRHKLVSNCLSCGKIVCEQEGEGPCSFCGALVLKEGSTYAGLENAEVPVSGAEAAAEAFAKRLVEYDRNAAARTTVIDDQSDYYEIEGNKWMSKEEKDHLAKKQREMKEAEEKRKNKVIISFDLVGRKVMVNADDASELESEYSILRPPEERELSRIKPNPTVRMQPVFVDTGPSRNPNRGKQMKLANGMCLEISGRVQRDGNELRQLMAVTESSEESTWVSTSTSRVPQEQGDSYECSLDYN